MRLLLDTHIFFWLNTDPKKLSTFVTDTVADKSNDLVLSVASIWEIQIKTQIGKMSLPAPLSEIVSKNLMVNGIEILDINLEHVLALDKMPQHHKDPFDRIIIAQAKVEDLAIVTNDAIFTNYEVKLLRDIKI